MRRSITPDTPLALLDRGFVSLEQHFGELAREVNGDPFLL